MTQEGLFQQFSAVRFGINATVTTWSEQTNPGPGALVITDACSGLPEHTVAGSGDTYYLWTVTASSRVDDGTARYLEVKLRTASGQILKWDLACRGLGVGWNAAGGGWFPQVASTSGVTLAYLGYATSGVTPMVLGERVTITLT